MWDSHFWLPHKAFTQYLLTVASRSMFLRGGRHNRLPIQNRIPHQAMIPAIHVPMKRIEVERNDVAAPSRHI